MEGAPIDKGGHSGDSIRASLRQLKLTADVGGASKRSSLALNGKILSTKVVKEEHSTDDHEKFMNFENAKKIGGFCKYLIKCKDTSRKSVMEEGAFSTVSEGSYLRRIENPRKDYFDSFTTEDLEAEDVDGTHTNQQKVWIPRKENEILMAPSPRSKVKPLIVAFDNHEESISKHASKGQNKVFSSSMMMEEVKRSEERRLAEHKRNLKSTVTIAQSKSQKLGPRDYPLLESLSCGPNFVSGPFEELEGLKEGSFIEGVRQEDSFEAQEGGGYFSHSTLSNSPKIRLKALAREVGTARISKKGGSEEETKAPFGHNSRVILALRSVKRTLDEDMW
ncbi:hypothetical protein FEM48_Zijuj12G0169200 [Ziziphus jujuba var. spinosa]|uniref:Uncharacterized protein n=1 Tax=Ziziphus jujuba var. spinosa TaxID=714518 RepID=A0A978UEI8_ZIZJJ|nr:hypothetical protein FEM48_Zijuj12G0169200 [Ziziphus jujuba var. spinosa]